MSTLNLLHISNHYLSNIEEFIPRVPEARALHEDDFIERVCVSDSIRGCLIGHPSVIDDFLPATDTPDYEISPLVYIPSLDLTGRIYKVYHIVSDKSEVMTPQELIDFNYVPDAHASNEHWLLNPTKPTHSEYIIVTDADCEPGDFYEVHETIQFEYTVISEEDAFSASELITV